MDIKSYGLNTLDDERLNSVEKNINDSDLKWIDARIDYGGKQNTVAKKWRTCKTSFLDFSQELDRFFWKIISDYNRNYSGWNYDLSFTESIQLTHYYEGHFYDWHVDTHAEPIIRNNIPHNRKVSASVFLNDPEEYEGGELDLEVRGPNSKEEERFDSFKLPKGSIIVFPSHVWHRVRPVTSGVRKSLVLWVQGPSFR
tara:strand:- start:214 stop:807 length:594 start_codon:yes stop_codon:yes gene_type:complete